MNLDQLRAGIERNKKGLAVAGVAGVAGLALMKRSKGGQPAAAGEDGPTSGSQYGLAPMPTTGAAYDSTSSDIYNAIQPQLESLGQMLSKAQEKPPIPVSAPPQFVRVAGRPDLTFYQDAGGKLDWLDRAELAAYGIWGRAEGATTDGPNNAKIAHYGADSQFWQGDKFLGTNPLKK